MDFRVRKVLSFMAAHLHEPLSLRELAAVARVSPDHLTRLFRASTGQTPCHSLKLMRLRGAERLLARTMMSVKEVAAATGFRDESHFVRDFEALYDFTPSQCRKVALEVRG